SRWSRSIDAALEEDGPKTDILIAQHHWPAWDPAGLRESPGGRRDPYKYTRGESVRRRSRGARPQEIADPLRGRPSLASRWIARAYYGTLRHNARAIYQKYLGWYDANPANLNPLPAREAARRTIDYMGGIDQVIARAREDFARGDY